MRTALTRDSLPKRRRDSDVPLMSTGTGAMAQAAYRLELAEIEQHRMMPRNIEAEQALLGAILINNAAFYHVSDFLRPNHSSSRFTARSTKLQTG